MMQGEDSSHLAALLHKIRTIASGSHDPLRDQRARASLLQASRELTTALEEPDETVSNLAFSGGRYACVRVADELNLFELLVERPRTATDLARITKTEETLLVRILRTLTAMSFAGQEGRMYYAVAATKQMTLPSVRAGVKHNFDSGLPVNHATPAYLKLNGYRSPRGMTDGPFQYTYQTDLQPYEYWKRTGEFQTFNTFMQGLFGTPARLRWLDWFPLEDIILSGFERRNSEYMFVDVGAGRGHETEAVLNKLAGVASQGKYIVQDLPFVIDDINDLDPRIERMAHNFMEPQPIKDARAYFLQNILHNWADPVCHTILVQLASAMKCGYSKLLIANAIVPDEGASLRLCSLDIAMLTLHSGAQRGEAEWTALLDKAGLDVVKFWQPPGDGDGIIEAELKTSHEGHVASS